MQTIYSLITHVMNGTVTMTSHVDNFSSYELAKQAKESVESSNKDCGFIVYCKIEETKLFENKDEVPILKNKK